MDRVFLDANVLFSAAYRIDSALRRLWKLSKVELISSEYAVTEARQNLDTDDHHNRLDGLLRGMAIVAESAEPAPLPKGVSLPTKDQPILAAAIAAGATHLLTGDKADFGNLFGKQIDGVLIQLPADYLAARTDAG